ncbi:MAG: DUF563 domain-containing protein [Microcoleaceae cyanobacterium]
MRKLWWRLSYFLRQWVIDQFVRKILIYLYDRNLATASRLISVLPDSKGHQYLEVRVLYDSVLLPTQTPQFVVDGAIEQEYLSRLVTQGNRHTGTVGIISARNVDISLPCGTHQWQHKIFREAILKESCFTNPKYALDVELIPFKRKQPVPEAVMLTLPFHHNFFHWMVEILPRLHLYDQSRDLHPLPLIVPSNSPGFVRESLTLTGYLGRVLFLGRGTYHFQKLHFLSRLSTAGDVSPLSIQWLNQKFPVASRNEFLPHKRRIYVSRRDAKTRYLTNDAEVQAVLSQFGFETITMSDYSLAQQIELFRQAEFVIGSHGAAFANLVFTPPGATLIEFFQVGHCHQAYYRIASLKGIQYGFLVGQPEGMGFAIEVKKLQQIVQQALSRRLSHTVG